MHLGPDDPNVRWEPRNTEILDSGSQSPRRRPLLASMLAVAVIALAAGGGVAYLAMHSGNNARTVASSQGAANSPGPSPSASAPSDHNRGPGRFFGGFGFGGTIHGQITVPKSGGGYQTVDVQTGTVTAVSSSSITVKSADGYSKTYVVSSSTDVNAHAAIGTVKKGDTVALTATVSGSTATAASIFDFASIRSGGEHFTFPFRHGSDQR